MLTLRTSLHRTPQAPAALAERAVPVVTRVRPTRRRPTTPVRHLRLLNFRRATPDPAPRSPQSGSKPAAVDERRNPPPSAPSSHPLRRRPGGRARCRWASPARVPGRSLACLDARASGPLLSIMERHATLSAGIAVCFAGQAGAGFATRPGTASRLSWRREPRRLAASNSRPGDRPRDVRGLSRRAHHRSDTRRG